MTDDEASTAGPPAAQQAGTVEDDEAFRAGLAELSQLATGDLSLPDMLSSVAEFAVRAIPGADGTGVMLWRVDRPDTVVASAEFVREVDSIQYRLGEGPCIVAAAEGRTIVSGSLGNDREWPRFGRRASGLGVHSVLSLPLQVQDTKLGALNVYAHRRNAFDAHAVQLGELFAAPASVSVQNAHALANARLLAVQLQSALNGRAIIDQALGIVMSRTGVNSQEAFERLRAMSQRENRKVGAIAQQIVDEAVRRARSRRTTD